MANTIKTFRTNFLEFSYLKIEFKQTCKQQRNVRQNGVNSDLNSFLNDQ